jgi:hypothetical protein
MGTERFLCEPTFVYDSRDTTFEGRQGLRVHRLATGMEAVQRSSRAHAGATCIKTACRGNVHQDRMPGAIRRQRHMGTATFRSYCRQWIGWCVLPISGKFATAYGLAREASFVHDAASFVRGAASFVHEASFVFVHSHHPTIHLFPTSWLFDSCNAVSPRSI